MDEFKESLKTADFKTNNLRETLSQLQDCSSTLLLFSLKWKDLEEHYTSLRNALSQREQEVCALEGRVRCRLRYLEERCRKFEVKRSELGILDESMKVLRKEIDVRECEFSERARLVLEVKGKEIEEKVEVLENVRREIAERLMEIEEREGRVERVFKEIDGEVEKKDKELEELWKETEMRQRSIECKDREFEKKQEELEQFWRRIELREREIVSRGSEFEKKQKELEESWRRIELGEGEIVCRGRELEKKEKELEELRKKIKTREKEIECKDREFGMRRQDYEENVVKLEKRIRETERRERESEIKYKEQFVMLENRKREVEEKMANVRLDEEKLKGRYEEIELRERKLSERIEEVDVTEKGLEELAEKLELAKRELEERVKETNLKERRLEERLYEFALENREFEERFREGIVWERRLFEGIKELEIREKQIQERNQEIDVAKNRLNIAALAMLRSEEPRKRRVDSAAGLVVQHCVVMDGNALQIFLNEHLAEHNKKREAVFALLRFCSDPAKLVLNAIVGFYPPHLKQGDREFEASVVRNSCLLLLEQLIEIGPKIKPHVKGEAMKLSFDWITQMKVDAEQSMEVVAFLELVCAYGLADAFDENELLDYAETVAHCRQIPKLCRALGLAGRIPGRFKAS